MKKLYAILAALVMTVACAFGLAGCGNGGASDSFGGAPEIPDSTGEPEIPDNTGGETPGEPDVGERNVLVVYFSWSSAGNTEKMANYIAEQTEATVREITPVTPYPTEYTPTTEVARKEKENNARPAIKDPLTQEQIDGYNSVFVGFPIWWHTAPMIIGTFLESYDWSEDAHIYPFFQGASNSNNSYYTETMEFINGCAAGATVHGGLYAAHGNTAAINSYLRANGFIK